MGAWWRRPRMPAWRGVWRAGGKTHLAALHIGNKQTIEVMEYGVCIVDPIKYYLSRGFYRGWVAGFTGHVTCSASPVQRAGGNDGDEGERHENDFPRCRTDLGTLSNKSGTDPTAKIFANNSPFKLHDVNWDWGAFSTSRPTRSALRRSKPILPRPQGAYAPFSPAKHDVPVVQTGRTGYKKYGTDQETNKITIRIVQQYGYS
ncbi:hypothetical protein BJ138DRAFT_1237840 [Hygrophoropsis aurantiaca]|uniref:Uncharacterized protein n=1 Tax=Hygrophoropsis aurantiaca TaxID=72124 RepID=A0ACB7ZUL0_9AGAM|nr:hypothetical protein BJ138DRAFT_1237840 [Hygrophoropsis aurantiaca]